MALSPCNHLITQYHSTTTTVVTHSQSAVHALKGRPTSRIRQVVWCNPPCWRACIPSQTLLNVVTLFPSISFLQSTIIRKGVLRAGAYHFSDVHYTVTHYKGSLNRERVIVLLSHTSHLVINKAALSSSSDLRPIPCTRKLNLLILYLPKVFVKFYEECVMED